MSKKPNDRGSTSIDDETKEAEAAKSWEAEQPSSASGESSKSAKPRDLPPNASTPTDDKPASSTGVVSNAEADAKAAEAAAKAGPAPASSANGLVTSAPSDRRLEQAILNMTPLPTGMSENAPTVDEKTGEKNYASTANRLAHTLEQVRQFLFDRNLAGSNVTLVAMIDEALTEHAGKPTNTEPIGLFTPPPTPAKPIEA